MKLTLKEDPFLAHNHFYDFTSKIAKFYVTADDGRNVVKQLENCFSEAPNFNQVKLALKQTENFYFHF